jgi:hypothetical protein
MRRRHGRARCRKTRENAAAGRALTALGELHAGNTARAPNDAAMADCGFEECKTRSAHGVSIRQRATVRRPDY